MPLECGLFPIVVKGESGFVWVVETKDHLKCPRLPALPPAVTPQNLRGSPIFFLSVLCVLQMAIEM